MSTVKRDAGVAGAFQVTFAQPPVGIPTVTIFSDAGRTAVATATAPMSATANPLIWTAAYPASLAASTYYLRFTAVFTTGQPAKNNDTNDLLLTAAGVEVDPDPSFATVAELSARLGKAFSGAAQVQAEALLLDASDHLRMLIGQRLTSGSAVVTFKHRVGDSRLVLPQWPVQAVDEVRVNGQITTNYELVDGALELQEYGPLDSSNHTFFVGARFGFVTIQVSFRYGFTKVPGDLRTWTCTLVSQALAQLEALGAIGATGLQSERLGEYAVNFATTGTGAEAFYVPPATVERLRASYGGGHSARMVGVR